MTQAAENTIYLIQQFGSSWNIGNPKLTAALEEARSVTFNNVDDAVEIDGALYVNGNRLNRRQRKAYRKGSK